MADPYKRLRRQIARKERREYYRRLHEGRLFDVAFRGYTLEQQRFDTQLPLQLDWQNWQVTVEP